MSEFDKEAEREKLRKKFAQDEKKRESTKRMSELLLKGATMTNQHCNRCGDPIFRYDGQSFCPSCQDAQVTGGQIQIRDPNATAQAAEPTSATNADTTGNVNGTGGADGTGDVTEATEATETTEATAAGTELRGEETAEDVATGSDGSAMAETPRVSDTVDSTRRAENTEADTRSTADVSTERPESTRPPASAADSESGASSSAETSIAMSQTTSALDGADLDDARASLRRTVTRYADAAERADDPRRARELLAAAHEAAETLAALRR